MNGKAAGTLGTAALLLAGGTWMALSRSYTTVGEALADKGYTWAATQTTSTGPVDFSVALPGWNDPGYPQAHYARYKVWHACSWGSPCSTGGCNGEALFGNWWAVEEVIRHPSNPLNIAGNQAYVATDQDFIDVERLALRGGGCDAGALRSYFIPTAKALGIIDPPPPTVTPPPPTPTPTSVPPGPGSTWSVTQRDCPSGAPRGSVCLAVAFAPSCLSTGKTEITFEGGDG